VEKQELSDLFLNGTNLTEENLHLLVDETTREDQMEDAETLKASFSSGGKLTQKKMYDWIDLGGSWIDKVYLKRIFADGLSVTHAKLRELVHQMWYRYGHTAWAMGPSGEEKAWGDPRFDNNLIPVNQRDFNGWGKGADATLTITQGIEVAEWSTQKATRIHTVGGSSNAKISRLFSDLIIGESYTVSLFVKNIGSSIVRIPRFSNTQPVLVKPGEVKFVENTSISTGTANNYFRISTENISDELDVIVFRPKLELGTKATPFALTNPTHVSEVIPTHSPEPPTNIPNWVYNWSAWVGGVTDSLPIYTHTAWAIGASGEEMQITHPSEDNNLIPVGARNFAAGWVHYLGAVIQLTQNVSVPEWGTNKATRIQTTGGTAAAKIYRQIVSSTLGSNEKFSGSIFVKNISETKMVMTLTGKAGITIMPGEEKLCVINSTATTGAQLQLMLGVEASEPVGSSLDFIVFRPKGERGEFATPFNHGTAATHKGTWTTNNPNALPFPELYDWKPI
jgi:hypothetical protein